MDLNLLLARRKGAAEALVGPHSAKQLTEDVWAIHTKGALVEMSEVDQAKLLVPCTITTQDSDRERDIVITAGGDLSLHQQNPVVLLDHGRGWSTKYPSVAQALDAEGNYSVTREPSRMRAVSRFSASVADSYQTFALIQEGLLNGVSIGFRMTLAKYRDDHDPEEYHGWPGLLISKWQLDEYSHCPIGMNPYCLADRVGKGYLGSERLSEGVWKSLLPHLPALREMASVPDLAGAKARPQAPAPAQTTNQPDATGGKPVSAANQTAPQAPPAPEAKAVEAPAQAQPPAAVTPPAPEAMAPGQAPVAAPAPQPAPTHGKGMNETTGSDGGYVVPDAQGGKKGDDADGEEDPTEGWRPGAKALAGCYAMLTAFGDFARAANEQQEHPAVREALDGYAEQTESMRSHASDTFAREYPDYEGLSEDAEDEDGGAKSVPSAKVKALMAVLVKGAGAKGTKGAADGAQAWLVERAKLEAERDQWKAAALKATDTLEALQKEVRKRNARK